MAQHTDRITRLWDKVVENRKGYQDSIDEAGGRVFVRPSTPRGGVVSIRILGKRPARYTSAPADAHLKGE